jgi:hypothetical protein
LEAKKVDRMRKALTENLQTARKKIHNIIKNLEGNKEINPIISQELMDLKILLGDCHWNAIKIKEELNLRI